jgi:hypothetical protein
MAKRGPATMADHLVLKASKLLLLAVQKEICQRADLDGTHV